MKIAKSAAKSKLDYQSLRLYKSPVTATKESPGRSVLDFFHSWPQAYLQGHGEKKDNVNEVNMDFLW